MRPPIPEHQNQTEAFTLARYTQSLADPEAFWAAEAALLTWQQPWHRVRRFDPTIAEIAWFEGGILNTCFNCVDRHAAETPEKTALIWAQNEPGMYQHIPFAELLSQVSRFANVLKGLGVGKGDRVCIYLPMIPELAYAILACARIGAVHSVVFAGFSAEALRDRILDATASLVITADIGLRGDKVIPLKTITDDAVAGLNVPLLVARRGDAPLQLIAGRDHELAPLLAQARPECPCEPMDAEDPLFILYTSGSTGKPKGVLHTTGGYLLYAASTFRTIFAPRPGDVHFCAADIGWVTGHSYILYGPLANAVTTVLFESLPTYPDAGRYWQIVDDLGCTSLYTAPTALRTLMRFGDTPVKQYHRVSLRILGSVGEPINPEVWRWYADTCGDGRCSVVDTWWQTETGGILISAIPGVTPLEPGSATKPLPGVDPVLVDEHGAELLGNDVTGYLCIRGTWPGQARSLWGDHDRFIRTYFSTYPGLFFTGDGARRDANGNLWVTGRVDDVLNVSGHRLGTAEIESALVTHPAVVEAAVVGMPHALKGTGIRAHVVVLPGEPPSIAELIATVRRVIGPFAAPDEVLIVPGLPKTRSGKIMRRILRKMAEGETENFGDLATLAEPGVVAEILRLTRG